MDNALATDGYYFSSEPFLAHPTIEATQLACLLDINQGRETILEARMIDDASIFQLALIGSLQIMDQHQRPISCQQLRQLPLDQLCEQKLTDRGWTVAQRPQFCWLSQQQPIGSCSQSISTCAATELNNLRSIIQQLAA